MSDKEKSEKKESKSISFLSSLSERAAESSFTEYFKRQRMKTYKGLFKDIEITKGQFLTLYLILLSFASVLAINIVLSLELTAFGPGQVGGLLISPEGGNFSGLFILIGIILGFILGGYMLDKIRGRRYPRLLRLLIVSILITILHVGPLRRLGDIPGFLFFGNSFVAGLLFMFFLTSFIDYTTILERGRVFSYLIIFLAVSLIVIIIVVSIQIPDFPDIFGYFPVVILILATIYLYKNKEQEEPYAPIRKEGTISEINYQIVMYLVLISAFNLSIGLFVPTGDLESLGTAGWSNVQVLIGMIITIIAALITAISVGSIFDFYGRKASISIIILSISVINLVRLFAVDIPYFDLAIILAAFLASFMSVPLLMSDISQRENLGKILGISFTLSLFSIGAGLILETVIRGFFPDDYTSDIFLIGVVNFASIVCLVFLMNTRETVSAKEKNWIDNLIHLYVIHESGMLLYEHSFIKEELAEADLISGGFVGLITILQEITKEEQRLKSIDHGGKRILFAFSANRSFIYALLVTEELLTLRNKLAYFVDEVEKQYHIILEDFNGIDVGLWKTRLDPFLEKHFKRKYFEIMPGMEGLDTV